MRFSAKKLVSMAVCAALAYLFMLVGRMPIVPGVEFLKYDPKDVIIVIGAFLFGVVPGALISVTVSLVEMVTVGSSGFIGLVMDILSTCAFVCPAALLYHRKRTLGMALAGLLLGAVLSTSTMLLWNWLITPLYTPYMSRADITAMLLPVFLPFNLIKCGLNAGLTLLLYKPSVTALRRANLLPNRGDEPKTLRSVEALLIGVVVLVSLILTVLVWRGIL